MRKTFLASCDYTKHKKKDHEQGGNMFLFLVLQKFQDNAGKCWGTRWTHLGSYWGTPEHSMSRRYSSMHYGPESQLRTPTWNTLVVCLIFLSLRIFFRCFLMFFFCLDFYYTKNNKDVFYILFVSCISSVLGHYYRSTKTFPTKPRVFTQIWILLVSLTSS